MREIYTSVTYSVLIIGGVHVAMDVVAVEMAAIHRLAVTAQG
jgi:hypothetical protein